MLVYLGIDPGARGACALIDAHAEILLTREAPQDAPAVAACIADAMAAASSIGAQVCCALEHSQARPGQGVTSMFRFGRNAGWWEGALAASHVPYLLIAPRRWQSAVLDSGGGKDAKARSLAAARRLWPGAGLTKSRDGLADALHLARYALLSWPPGDLRQPAA
jgi:hypothetical protein